MECGRCGRNNPDHVKYCLDCGSALSDLVKAVPVQRDGAYANRDKKSSPPQLSSEEEGGRTFRICSTCSARNPQDASFCCECGSRVTDPPLAASRARAPQHARDASQEQLRKDKHSQSMGGTLVVASRPLEPREPREPRGEMLGTLASAVPNGAETRDAGVQNEAPLPPLAAGASPRGPETPPPRAERRGQHYHQEAKAPGQAQASVGEFIGSPAVQQPPAPRQHAIAPQLQQAPGYARNPNAVNEIQSRSCPACGGSSSPSARFCQLCGVPFEGTSGERPRSNPPSLAAELVPQAQLVVIAQDGSPGRKYSLAGERTTIGKNEVDINLGRDPYVSPLHAEICYRSGRFYLSDRGSLNGVFVRLGGSSRLMSGDLLLVGLGVLRFEVVEDSERNLAPQTRNGTRVFGSPASPRYARLTTQTVEGVARERYYLSRAETVLGREVGDIVFTDDPFMSRRHAAIRRDPNSNHFSIRDLGSSNGTFLALRNEQALSPGDHIRIGQHLFRLDVQSDRQP